MPFHMWTPDAYEGAPLPITAYLSATSKAAGFALLLRLFSQRAAAGDRRLAVHDRGHVGDNDAGRQPGRAAAAQHQAPAGVLEHRPGGLHADGITALSPAVSSALLLHMTGYVITNVAAFTAIIAYHNATGAEEIRDFRGASDRAPLLSAVMAVALFSLAGMPLFAGFLTKFILFQSVAANHYYWLAALAVVASLISLYYYLQVIREMYVNEGEDKTRFQVPLVMQGMAVLLTVGVFFVGLYPAPLFDVTDKVSKVPSSRPHPSAARAGAAILV